MSQENSSQADAMMKLGGWLGRHQAFGLIATRCSAADAECLKAIRDGGEYKQLGLTWDQFCTQHAGISRVSADRQIHCLEEFGANYFQFVEVMQISPATFRLIAGAVTGEGLECNGERIPLVRENREKLASAVAAMRPKPETTAGAAAKIGLFRRRLEELLDEAHGIANRPDRRPALIGVLEEGGQSLHQLALALREKTLVLR